jgi:hypothetical protein
MTDADCASGGFVASCEPAESGKKWCAAHVDVDLCDSGLKWGSLAGDGLASTCLATVADAGPGDGLGMTLGFAAARRFAQVGGVLQSRQ